MIVIVIRKVAWRGTYMAVKAKYISYFDQTQGITYYLLQ